MSLIVQVNLVTAQLIGSYAYELQCLLVIVHLSILHSGTVWDVAIHASFTVAVWDVAMMVPPCL